MPPLPFPTVYSPFVQIENAKVAKREQKIVSRFQRHTERTAQAFEDERATRLSKFMLFGESPGRTTVKATMACRYSAAAANKSKTRVHSASARVGTALGHGAA